MLLELTDGAKKHVCYVPDLSEMTIVFLKTFFKGKKLANIKVKELAPSDILFWPTDKVKRYASLVSEQEAHYRRKNSPPVFLAVQTCAA